MADSLFELKKDYYLGNFQSCVNKANSMPSCAESYFYMCLSYCHLKKYDILELEVSKSEDTCVQLVGMLASYIKNERERDGIVRRIDSMLEDMSIDPKDELSRLAISAIYSHHNQYAKALGVLHGLDSLVVLHAVVQILIKIDRLDIAERRVSAMQNKDDYATLTMLALAQLRLVNGNPKEARDIASELEEKYRATPLLKNLQTAACICDGDYEAAKEHCESSLDMDNENLEGLINLVHIQTKLHVSAEIRDRNYKRLQVLYPNNEYVKENERLRSELRAELSA